MSVHNEQMSRNSSAGRSYGENDAIAGASEKTLVDAPSGAVADSDECEHEIFRNRAYQVIDYIVNYQRTIRSRQVMPSVQPGYMRGMIPEQAPEEPDEWRNILADVDRIIMPGMAHWLSPQFHAYYPSGSSNPALLGDMLSDALGCIGISWASAPACTELEVHMLDWLGKLLGLPREFIFESGCGGGGVIQGSACETTLITMMAARSDKFRELINTGQMCAPGQSSKLVAFASDQAHSSMLRAGLLTGLRIRTLTANAVGSLTAETLRQAIDDEINQGNFPFYLLACLGTTASCAFDDLAELGPVCNEHGVWMHIDAAYAGAAFICPEFRYLLAGIEDAASFNFNAHKFLLTTLDCSLLWVRHSKKLTDVFQVHALFLKTRVYDMPNYRHWTIQLSRRFRSLKLWFVIRMYGAQGLREHIRRHVSLAKRFEQHVLVDDRFEVAAPVVLGLVCFRLKKFGNVINDHLLCRINDSCNIHMVPALLYNDLYVLRFAVCSEHTNSRDIDFAWREIQKHATDLLASNEVLNRGKVLWGSVRAASLGLRLFHNWNSV